MRQNVDKVALTARWLVIHTRKRLVYTRSMVLLFIYVFYIQWLRYTTSRQYWSATYGMNRRVCRSNDYTHTLMKNREKNACALSNDTRSHYKMQ